MITAFIGGLYALMEHNIQRLLAYHTTENIGIILLGLGAFVTGVATRNSTLMVLGFIGGMYHLINHSLFKTTLFLGAGAVWFRTGHRDIEKLGGIGKNAADLPRHAGGADGNGCPAAAERLRRRVGYLSILLQNEHWRPVYRPFAGAATGRWPGDHWRTGGDVYGESLRRDLPRRAADERGGIRHLRPRLMTLSVVLAAVFCLVGGIAAPWLLPLVSGAFPVQAQVSSVVSQPMIALLLIACPLLPFLLMIFFKGDRGGALAARRGSAVTTTSSRWW